MFPTWLPRTYSALLRPAVVEGLSTSLAWLSKVYLVLQRPSMEDGVQLPQSGSQGHDQPWGIRE